jgi:3-hydroxybutyryl-CoA dehydrogenase
MKVEDIKTVGVVGMGVMGRGISISVLFAGYKVIGRDLNDEILAKAKDDMINGRFGMKGAVERGKITKEQMDQALAKLTLTTKLEDLKSMDLIIEAIGGANPQQLENKDLKLQVFKELDGLVKKEAVFASNTSMFSIRDLAAVTERKDRFLGLHFFSPANIMRLVEVIWTPELSKDVLEACVEFCKKIGKVPVKVKDMPGDLGHVGNRIYAAGRREARKILEEGVVEKPEDINTVMTLGFNWPVGPMAMGAGARAGWK